MTRRGAHVNLRQEVIGPSHSFAISIARGLVQKTNRRDGKGSLAEYRGCLCQGRAHSRLREGLGNFHAGVGRNRTIKHTAAKSHDCGDCQGPR